MRNLTYFLCAIVIGMAAALLGGGAIANVIELPPTTPTTTTVQTTPPTIVIDVPTTAHITTRNTPDGQCYEDDPCWDCHTMGNRICGPIILPHTR